MRMALLLAVVVAAWLRRRYVVVTVDGPSMLPAFRPGERLLVRRTATVRRGDCVVFADSTGTEWIVKRAVAVPGDLVPRIEALRSVRERLVPTGHLVALGTCASADILTGIAEGRAVQ